MCVFLLFPPFFILLFVYILPRYNDITTSGLASLNWVLKIPLIGPFSKYIFNILSPFPHYNFISLSNQIFGGNILYFIFHILGILYILIVIINLSNYFIKRNLGDDEKDKILKSYGVKWLCEFIYVFIHFLQKHQLVIYFSSFISIFYFND